MQGEATVVEHDRHREAHAAAIGQHVLQRVVEAGVDRDHHEVRAGVAERALEVRHLLAARYAPRGPELEVDGLVPVQAAEIDVLAVDGGQHQPRRRRAEQCASGIRGALRAATGVALLSNLLRCPERDPCVRSPGLLPRRLPRVVTACSDG